MDDSTEVGITEGEVLVSGIELDLDVCDGVVEELVVVVELVELVDEVEDVEDVEVVEVSVVESVVVAVSVGPPGPNYPGYRSKWSNGQIIRKRK
jgi:hypothetical protein